MESRTIHHTAGRIVEDERYKKRYYVELKWIPPRPQELYFVWQGWILCITHFVPAYPAYYIWPDTLVIRYKLYYVVILSNDQILSMWRKSDRAHRLRGFYFQWQQSLSTDQRQITDGGVSLLYCYSFKATNIKFVLGFVLFIRYV